MSPDHRPPTDKQRTVGFMTLMDSAFAAIQRYVCGRFVTFRTQGDRLIPDAQRPPVMVVPDRDCSLPDLADAEAMGRWLTAAGVNVEALPGLPNWDAPPGTAQEPQHRRLPADFDRQVDDVLDSAFAQAVRVPFGAAVLCCYVRLLCLGAWKRSYHFDRMWATLRGARRCWAAHRAGVRRATDLASTDATAILLDVLDWEIAAENEMVGNNPERLAAAARRAAQSARTAVEAAAAIPPDGAAVAEFVVAEGVGSQRCDLAQARAGEALSAFFAGRTDGAELLTRALAGLRVAEGGTDCDRDQRSELRGYRKTMERLIETCDDDWLHIDEGNVVHMYPFAVRGMPPDRIVAAIRSGGQRWEVAGIHPRAIHDTIGLDDVWNGSDALGRRYDGAVIKLPEVTIEDLDGRPLARLTADLRLSLLGNHCLRLTMDLRDRSVHELYSAVLLSAPEQAEVRVRCAGGERVWSRLSALAVDLVEGLSKQLGAPAAVSVRPGMFHVVIAVLEASIGRGPRTTRSERRPVESIAQLRDVTGAQVLLRPVPHIFGAPAEWVHYQVRDKVVLDIDGRHDELFARTCNTTVIAALGSPDYWITTRLQVGEFAASLDGLFAGWFDQLAIFLSAVTRHTDEPVDEQDIDELARQADLLERQQVGLHAFAADARAMLDLIRSPALVASPLVARVLHATLVASGFGQREAELTRNIDAVLDDRLGRRLDILVRRRRDREAQLMQKRERRQRARLDSMLAVIAAVGISGLGQILQAGYELRRTAALLIIGVIIAIVVLFGTWFQLSNDPEQEHHGFARLRHRRRRR